MTAPVWKRLRGDSGAETVGLAVLFPVVLVLILSMVQGGLWWHAHAVAAQAAQAGVDAGRPVGATSDTASEAARSFAARAGRGVLAAPEAHATATADTVQVTVSGTAVSLLPFPGLEIRVDANAQATKERFTVPTIDAGASS
ncbi:pilus assembly protein TadE [Amycolatopsis acidicola]|uniref:Pilus assembly protein TadE n=1 Tax=Amycolatopsis acidicola TaxID=2596893 RepID=A0A5N0V590_9PSEU|nr:TadE/TadG family type IV pilus assembly protein [Amycolatopsis acidicola]KAA9159433.1 pilus assembly protein TadE [Amycolatopsis acidicola]